MIFFVSFCPFTWMSVPGLLLPVLEVLIKDTSTAMWFYMVNDRSNICEAYTYEGMWVSTHCAEYDADISIILDIFIQKGTKCSTKRQFNSPTAHFHQLQSLITSSNSFPQTTEAKAHLILFFLHSLHLILSTFHLSASLSLSPSPPLLIFLFMCLTRAGANALAFPSNSLKCIS